MPFKKGQSGNPKGRPPRKTEQAFLNATIGAVTIAAWKRITLTAVEQAEAGDDKARRWLSDYVLGKPTQHLEHTGKDGGAIQTEQQIRFIDYGIESEADDNSDD